MLEQEGYDFMAAAFEVYNEVGYGLAEEVYQQCLEVEPELRRIPYRTQCGLQLAYKGRRIPKVYVPDLFVFDALVVELKAVQELISDHEAQLFNYMRIARQPVGYLVSFGRKGGVQWKRLILSDLK
ncbi:MAG: GxxExxY protein [Planctomycetaceae bacterium]|nr:GxxExxY protein [Planctomycetaceae bacterium]